ncbi:hypothetical protein [Desulfolutivibrio sp.]|uniref:hypothetical protein n=1 Tax=Desulfolutivibrio sp. TaxID=2773296 RepID=UPI002F96AEC4
MKFLLPVLLVLIIVPGSGYCQSYEVKVGAENNCCASIQNNKERCLSNAVKLKLEPGQYKAHPTGGAVSRYPSNKDATLRKTQPWFWLVMVFDGKEEYFLGSEVKYPDAKEAFVKNADEVVDINLSVQTTLYFYLTDEHEGMDKCSGNRGEAVLEIVKIK